jgi:hypothetical protein
MGCSQPYWRPLTRNTLPLTVGHLHPSIGPALIVIEKPSRRVGTATFEAARRYDRIPNSATFTSLYSALSHLIFLIAMSRTCR